MSLHNQAMLVRLAINMWTARKYDRKVSDKVAVDHGAGSDAGRYNKVLVARDAIKAIEKMAGAARTFHYENTLPWSDTGARILPSMNFDHYSAQMRQLRADFERAVTQFADSYPVLVEDARALLNGMFNEQDYPHASSIKGRFGFSITIDPIPLAADFRVDLAYDETERIRQEIETRVQEAQTEAMRSLWKRLYDAVKHMAEKLLKEREDGKSPIFHDTLVTNLCELAALLPRLNVTDDPNLEAMRKEVEDRLCVHDPQELRDQPGVRQEVAKDAKAILDSMAGYLG
jgi:hypothetical protein